MGLERIAAVMQGKYDNYEIDIFAEVYGEFSKFLSSKFGISDKTLKSKEAKIASRVIADHIRAAVFLIVEGIIPSNERAGYVLRSIIRRASYYLYHLGVQQPCFFQFLYPLLRTSGDLYPELELEKKKQSIASTIEQEEIQFLDTLDRGSKILNQEIGKLKNKTIPGSVIFTLHDTYGFPSILTSEIARQRGLTVDQSGFDAAMEKQREASRSANKFSTTNTIKITMDGTTKFIGYTHNSCSCKIRGLFKTDGHPIEHLKNGEKGIIVLDKTPFYAESGGQVGDTGEIYSEDGVFIVQDTQKYGGLFLHHGTMAKGKLSPENAVVAEIDEDRRQAIKLNHSTTHLLHNSLRFVLGDQAIQRGSLVDDKKLRFDFTNPSALTTEELRELEQIVNHQIHTNLKTQTQIKSLEEAQQENVLALFGEKYGDEVRVVKMGEFSKELCGGTHVDSTGEIGLFKIVSESSVAAGIRRIEGVTGENALTWINEIENVLKNAGQLLNAGTNQIVERIQQILDDKIKQEKELSHLQSEKLTDKSKSLIDQTISVGKIKVVATIIPNVDSKALRQAVDSLKQQLKSAVVTLATVTKDNKIQIIVGVTQDLVKEIKANELLQHITKQIDGSGGGRPDMAQGGGTKVNTLQKALDSVVSWVKEKI
jgi:alanyl-tRNA synthetase